MAEFIDADGVPTGITIPTKVAPDGLTFTEHLLAVDDLPAGHHLLVSQEGRPRMTMHARAGTRAWRVVHDKTPVIDVYPGGAIVVEDGSLPWRTLVNLLNALQLRWYGNSVTFHTEPDRTNARGHVVPSRSLFMQVGKGPGASMSMVGQYSRPVSYPQP